MRSDVSIETIKEAFDTYSDLLNEAGIEADDVAPQELVEYFSAPTPTEDTTTLHDVVSHRWLFLHEMVELKHLKLKGYEISSSLVWDHEEAVLGAHVAATAVELKLALKHDDREWVRKRVKLIPSWLEDSDFPEHYREACAHLLDHYSQV
ncbi:hypothetical protein EU537_08905 [Candidatus Thorarchaeota archaeon]|nr:MAG: hypothetical protein EU537_08905 [Candidatus Thorarchaeota archaeon]